MQYVPRYYTVIRLLLGLFVPRNWAHSVCSSDWALLAQRFARRRTEVSNVRGVEYRGWVGETFAARIPRYVRN